MHYNVSRAAYFHRTTPMAAIIARLPREFKMLVTHRLSTLFSSRSICSRISSIDLLNDTRGGDM